MSEKFERKHDDFVKKFANRDYGYCDPALKKSMHRAAAAYLRELASALGFDKSQYDVRSNPAGIACSGEITLHTDSLYVQINESFSERGKLQLLIRGCKSRRDYAGMHNNFANFRIGNAKEVIGVCMLSRRKEAA